MKKKRCALLVLLLCAVACNKHEYSNKLLVDAEKRIDSHPMDALRMLQNIEKPESFPDSLKARYYVNLSKALLYTNTPSTSDSLLIQPVAFYKQNKDTSRLLVTLYLKSRINYRNYNTRNALQDLREALPLVTGNKNNAQLADLQLQFGYTYLLEKKYPLAEQWLKAGINTAQSSKDSALLIAGWTNLSLLRKRTTNLPLAILNIKEAEHIAQARGDKYNLNLIYQQLTDYYEQHGDYRLALSSNDSVRKYRDSRMDVPAINLKKALLLWKLNAQDSAAYYAQRAYQSNDFLVADLAYSLLSDIERKQGRFQEAWKYRIKYRDLYEAFDSDIQSAAMQQKYQKAKLENENNQLKIRKNERDLWLLCIVFAVCILAAVMYIAFLQYRRRQSAQKLLMQQELIQSKADQLEKENLLLRQNQEISHLREKEALMRESLFKRIRFFQKIPSLHPCNEQADEQKSPASGKILLTEEDWTELIQNMNEIFPGFTGRLKNMFPELDQDEILFCCLVKINVNLQDLSDIYCLSKAAITKRKYRIKKDRLHVTDSTISLDEFLRTF